MGSTVESPLGRMFQCCRYKSGTKTALISPQDPSGSQLYFADGSTVSADVVIGADGIHVSLYTSDASPGSNHPQSVVSQSVVGEAVPAHETGQSAFRFLIPTVRLLEDPETRWLVEDKPATMNIFKNDDRRLVAYPCKRFGEIAPGNLKANDEKRRARQLCSDPPRHASRGKHRRSAIPKIASIAYTDFVSRVEQDRPTERALGGILNL